MKNKLKLVACALAMVSLASCGGNKSKENQEEIFQSAEQQQLNFEEEYIKGKYSYAEGGKFAMSMLSNIGSIAAGVAFNSPTSVVGGIFGILTSVNDTFAGSSGPTIADVMNKLNEMDTKLDAINEKIDENYNQLATEEIRTQALVNQVMLEEQEAAIEAFHTNYVVPVENFERDYSDYMEQSYKAYVKDKEEADIYIYRNEDKEWVLSPIVEEGGVDQQELRFTIPDFTNSLTFLEKNYNVVTKGFMDRFYEDIDNAVANTELPTGLDKETCRNYVAGNIAERFTQAYYKENHQKALDLRNMAINYAKEISGKSVKSVVDRYVSRMEYMYNFAGEMKNPTTDLFANLIHELDVNTTLAAQACMYAEVNQEEIKSEYTTARETIQKYYENVQSVNNGYCFVTNTNMSGGFYRAYFSTSYSNKGNNCSFSSSFTLDNVNTRTQGYYTRDNISKHNCVSDLDHTRIAMRMNLMRQIGLTNTSDYALYLNRAGVLPDEAYNTYSTLCRQCWISNDAYRFLTGLTTREMNDGDKHFTMQCNDCGNPGGDYFNVGWRGTFRGGHSSDKWSGRIAETKFISGFTGQVMSDKTVAAYATYNESHWYWRNDEHWSFIDNPAGNYFFILENVA